MSVNLKAPIVINVDTRKALQVVLEDDMPVKFFVYEILKSRKENAAKEKKD